MPLVKSNYDKMQIYCAVEINGIYQVLKILKNIFRSVPITPPSTTTTVAEVENNHLESESAAYYPDIPDSVAKISTEDTSKIYDNSAETAGNINSIGELLQTAKKVLTCSATK